MLSQLEIWNDHVERHPAAQMALDEALLLIAQTPTLRFYHWAAPVVTFGYSQRYTEVLRLAGSLPAIRRCTGGGIVFHDVDLTLALAIPKNTGFPNQTPQFIYQKIHQWLLDALSIHVSSLRLAESHDCSGGNVCFENPALCDILEGNKKVCGGALRRSRGGILYQGSIRLALTKEDISRMFIIPKISSRAVNRAENLAFSLEQKYTAESWNQRR